MKELTKSEEQMMDIFWDSKKEIGRASCRERV